MKIFKTKNGRDLIDGRGIEPDIKVEEKEMSRLTATIYANNLVFNYATTYAMNHPEIANAKTFSLTDEEYTSFKSYVLKETFSIIHL